MGDVTHNELVTAGAKWLKNSVGARAILTELTAFTAYGEIPDVIGWKSCHSLLLECKSSRSDFLADRKKIFRIYPEYGMGNFRFYLCPEGLIKPDELPDKWGLLYLTSKNKIKRIVCFKGNVLDDYGNLKCQESERQSEISMLVSHISRKSTTFESSKGI